MKKILKQERGVSLISLAAAIIVIGIVVTMLLYSVKDTKDVTNLTNMYSDIDNLSDKISNYYSTYGKIPAKEISGLDAVIAATWPNNEGNPRGVNDTGKFLYIDLNAIDNLNLNYGRSFSQIESKSKNNETLTAENSSNLTDLYIINENSHNVFYLRGINIEGTKYYTNKDKDTEKVNLRYVDGIKILDGFTYKSGRKKESANPITITDGTNDYFWANIEDGIYKLDESTLVATDNEDNTITITLGESQDKDEFLTSVHEFGGFYLNEDGNIHYSLVLDKWSQTYDVETVYKDKNGDKAYIPAGFQISELNTMNTINKGLVIRNGTTLDEYVWIDVPDYVLQDANTLDEIERALKAYSSSYHEDGYEDTWYQGCGIATEEEYNNLKNSMYLSIKENGGFYIGRYEAGTNTLINADSSALTVAELKNTYGIPLSQKDKYCYDWVTIAQAQSLATEVGCSNRNTSLMFGIQWDLICKFVEESGMKTKDEIIADSSSWGNYKNVSFFAKNVEGKESYNGNTQKLDVFEKKENVSRKLSTGITDRNKVLNIYDLAGNMNEFTLLYNKGKDKVVLRGGDSSQNGYKHSFSYVSSIDKTSVYAPVGFRVTIF